MKYTIEILSDEDVFDPEDWCRPIQDEGGDVNGTGWVGIINNLKWIKVKDRFGPAWYGRKFKEYYKGSASTKFEFVKGNIPKEHTIKKYTVNGNYEYR